MLKKIFAVATILLVSTLVIAGVTFAAEENSPTIHPIMLSRGRINFGKITELSSDSFTIMTRGGGSYMYLVDENTRYRIKDVENPSFSELTIDQYVLVKARMVEGELLAKVVGITPEGFNPAKWFGVRVRGKVAAVDLDEGTVSISKPAGEEVSFLVGDRTKFIGEASGLEDIKVGWVIGVAGGKKDDGTHFASIVAASAKRHRVKHAGTITGIEEMEGLISIHTRGGEDKVFSIGEETKFHSRNGEIEEVSNLQLDMAAIVVAVLQEDDTYQVTHIAAINKEDLPNFEVKASGKVIAIVSDGFTIETKEGEEVAFSVNSETNFRSRGLIVKSLENIKLGMIIHVSGDESESGVLIAKLVILLNIQTP